MKATGKKFSLTIFATIIMILSACKEGDSPTEPTPPEPNELSIQTVSGSEQTGVVATELAQSLVVKVSDPNGDPVSSTKVTWSVGAGKGLISTENTTTDDQGKTQVDWTLGTVAGEQEVTAEISESSSSVTFTATAEPDEPTQFILTPETVVLQTWGDSLQLSADIAISTTT